MTGNADTISTAKDIFLEEINDETGEFKDETLDESSIILVGETLNICYTYGDTVLVGLYENVGKGKTVILTDCHVIR